MSVYNNMEIMSTLARKYKIVSLIIFAIALLMISIALYILFNSLFLFL